MSERSGGEGEEVRDEPAVLSEQEAMSLIVPGPATGSLPGEEAVTGAEGSPDGEEDADPDAG